MLQSGQAAGDTGSSLRLLAEHVQATLMQPVEQLLLVDYPLRSPPADAEDPGLAFKLDEVSVSLKVGVLTSFLGCKKLILPQSWSADHLLVQKGSGKGRSCANPDAYGLCTILQAYSEANGLMHRPNS